MYVAGPVFVCHKSYQIKSRFVSPYMYIASELEAVRIGDVFYWNGLTDWANCWYTGFRHSTLHCFIKKLTVSKIRVYTSLWKFVSNSTRRKISPRHIDRRNSTDDRHQFYRLSVHLCVQHHGRDAARTKLPTIWRLCNGCPDVCTRALHVRESLLHTQCSNVASDGLALTRWDHRVKKPPGLYICTYLPLSWLL